jgi:hypothetical protein
MRRFCRRRRCCFYALTTWNRLTYALRPFSILITGTVEKIMSFTFTDSGSPNNEVRTNVWNWKPTLEIIRDLNVIGEMGVRQLKYNATGYTFTEEEAQALGAGIRAQYVAKMTPKQRVRTDLSITDDVDDGTLYSGDDSESWKNYGATYNWLEEFADFCLKSKGFQIY